MKIIHTADIHLGSKMECILDKEKAKARRAELCYVFRRITEYAKENGVSVILLSGDIFDSDSPSKKDKASFFRIVMDNPNIDFLYLRGNHDIRTSYEEEIPNLKTFSSEWTSYVYGDVKISGIEVSHEIPSSLYSNLSLSENEKNIVMIHSEITEARSIDSGISIPRLAGKNIDYLALGHIHSYKEGKIDGRGKWCYSGCPEGRGFDECGEKGFVLLDINERIDAKFVPFSYRQAVEFTCDVSSCEDVYSAISLATRTVNTEIKNMVRLYITGLVSFDTEFLATHVSESLFDYFCVSVKDLTRRKYDIADYECDKSFAGEFVRGVLCDKKLTDDEKGKIIETGLSAIDGRLE